MLTSNRMWVAIPVIFLFVWACSQEKDEAKESLAQSCADTTYEAFNVIGESVEHINREISSNKISFDAQKEHPERQDSLKSPGYIRESDIAFMERAADMLSAAKADLAVVKTKAAPFASQQIDKAPPKESVDIDELGKECKNTVIKAQSQIADALALVQSVKYTAELQIIELKKDHEKQADRKWWGNSEFAIISREAFCRHIDNVRDENEKLSSLASKL